MRTRKLTLVSIAYNVVKPENGTFTIVKSGEMTETTGTETAKTILEKENKGCFVTVEKVNADYLLDVDGAIKAGLLVKVTE